MAGKRLPRKHCEQAYGVALGFCALLCLNSGRLRHSDESYSTGIFSVNLSGKMECVEFQ